MLPFIVIPATAITIWATRRIYKKIKRAPLDEIAVNGLFEIMNNRNKQSSELNGKSVLAEVIPSEGPKCGETYQLTYQWGPDARWQKIGNGSYGWSSVGDMKIFELMYNANNLMLTVMANIAAKDSEEPKILYESKQPDKLVYIFQSCHSNYPTGIIHYTANGFTW